MLKLHFFWMCVSLYAQIVCASPFDYPVESMVRIGLPQIQPETTKLCTGVIINSAYMLTHANCSNHYGSDRINVTIAFINTIVTEQLNGAKKASVRLNIHNFHRGSPNVYDMMLLEMMDTHIQYDSYVHPAALYFGETFRVFQGHVFEECAIMGWLNNHSTSYLGFLMHSLASTNVSILSNTDCLSIFPSLQNVICVKSEISVCSFEFGAALVCGSNMKWVFMGYYTGYHNCDSKLKIFVFRRYYFISEWLNKTSNGVYALETDVVDAKVMMKEAKDGQGKVSMPIELIGLSVWICCNNLINT